jgi:hypothetical protein
MIMKKEKLFILTFAIIFFLTGVYAQGNETNQTAPNLILTNFMPQEVKLGDAQFNLQIQNNQNETATNIIAFVTGNGFSTYNMIPIDSLAPGDKSYIFVYGNLKQAGNLTLTINVNNIIFYQNITVIDPNATSDQQKLEELQMEQEKEQQIKNISDQLNLLEQNFTSLETELTDKQSNNYDVSLINLNTLDNYLHNIQADILTENVDDAKVNLDLANDEYIAQKNKLDNAKKVPLITILKNNVVLFSTFAGAILTLFALYELLKKQKKDVEELRKKIIKKKK